MHQRQRRLHARVGEVGVVVAQLAGQQHAFVVDYARRQRGDVTIRGPGDVGCANVVFDLFADDEEFAFESIGSIGIIGGSVAAIAARDKHLLNHRLSRQHAAAEAAVVDRHCAPAQHALPLGARVTLDHRLAIGHRGARHEHHAGRVVAGRGQIKRHRLGEETMRQLQQQPRAVAGLRVGADRAAVA